MLFPGNHFQAEIGYELANPYWRQGIMTEALVAVIKWGFHTLAFNRIEAVVISGAIEYNAMPQKSQ